VEIARELGGKEVSAEDAKAVKEQTALAQKGCEISCEQAGNGKAVRADKLAKLDECNRKPSCDDYAKCLKQLGK